MDRDTPGTPASGPRRAAAALAGRLIVLFARLLTGVRAIWSGSLPLPGQTLYFANHNSHADFVLLWSTLPPELRKRTRPVAGYDYWMTSPLRRFIGQDVFGALMIRRDGSGVGDASAPNPVEQMTAALRTGDSLIMFPEGTRNTGDDTLLPFKSGLYHLARGYPQVRLVPVWIENLRRVLPKGTLVPIPLACTVRFGPPVVLRPDEDKTTFITRARNALLDLRPEYDRAEDGRPA
jgi:1-acyl-sn-glycerol-3-phosphate acyltransferase